MKNKKVQKLLAVSVLACMMSTTTGCSMQEVIDNFNPAKEIPMPAYGMHENFNFADDTENIDDTVEIISKNI